MPPRKSDQRGGDATTAAHDETAVSFAPADDPSRDSAAPSSEKKDKDKDKDPKDKDAATIEV